MGQRPGPARIAQGLGRVFLHPALPLAKLKKAADAGQATSDRRLGIAGFLQAGNVTAEVQGADRVRVRTGLALGGEPSGEGVQIFPVTFDRQRGNIPLDFQIPQKTLDSSQHEPWNIRPPPRRSSSFVTVSGQR